MTGIIRKPATEALMSTQQQQQQQHQKRRRRRRWQRQYHHRTTANTPPLPQKKKTATTRDQGDDRVEMEWVLFGIAKGGNNGPRAMESLRLFSVCPVSCPVSHVLCPAAPFRFGLCKQKQTKPNQTKRNEINPKPQNVKKDKARSKFQLSTMQKRNAQNIWSKKKK